MKDQVDELINRCNKMALLLGIVRGSIGGMYYCPSTANETKKTLRSLLEFLSPRIDELFYDKVAITPIFVDDPQAIVKEKAEDFLKRPQNFCKLCNKYHIGAIQCVSSSGIWPPNCS